MAGDCVASFPLNERRAMNPDKLPQSLIAQSERVATPLDQSGGRVQRVVVRVVSEKSYDLRIPRYHRLALAAFPPRNRVLAGIKRNGYVPLQQTAFDALLADMLANGLRQGIVSLCKRLFRTFKV